MPYRREHRQAQLYTPQDAIQRRMHDRINLILNEVACTKDEKAILSKMVVDIREDLPLYGLNLRLKGMLQVPTNVEFQLSPNTNLNKIVRFDNKMMYTSFGEGDSSLLLGFESFMEGGGFNLATDRLKRIIAINFGAIKQFYKNELREQTERRKQCMSPMIVVPRELKEQDNWRPVNSDDANRLALKDLSGTVLDFGRPIDDFSGTDNTTSWTTDTSINVTGSIYEEKPLYFMNQIYNSYGNFDMNTPTGTVIISPDGTTIDTDTYRYCEQGYGVRPLQDSYVDTIRMRQDAFATRMHGPDMSNPFHNFFAAETSSEERALRAKENKALEVIKEKAETKAQKLLKDMISEVDFRRYKEKGFIIVKGASGRVYRIWNNKMIDVYELGHHQIEYKPSDSGDDQRRLIQPTALHKVILPNCDGKLKLKRKLCIHSPGNNLPKTDEVMLKYMLAKNDEIRLLEMAHHFEENKQIRHANEQPNQVTPLGLALQFPDPSNFTAYERVEVVLPQR